MKRLQDRPGTGEDFTVGLNQMYRPGKLIVRNAGERIGHIAEGGIIDPVASRMLPTSDHAPAKPTIAVVDEERLGSSFRLRHGEDDYLRAS